MPCLFIPEIQSDLQRLAIEELDRCLVLAERYFDRSFVLDAVSFCLRGRSAGQFRSRTNKRLAFSSEKTTVSEVRLNAAMLEEYGEQFIADTIGHEVAHFIVFELYGRKVRPHGREWQAVMSEVLKRKPEVTHQYNTKPARRLKRYAYLCECPDHIHELTSIRHNKVLNQQARYLCRQCHSAIVAQG